MQTSAHTASAIPMPHTTTQPAAAQFSLAGVIWLKLAILYLVLGVVMGIAMGASRNFTLMPVHAHVNLLGWATMALAGLVYTVFPAAGGSRLAKVHFWLANISMPVMVVALSMVLLGNHAVEPVLALSEILAAAGVAAFAANLFLNLGRS
ncbi:cbb3-type cytochrome c oxidase subunit I [Massilia solisilvae]|uniref:Cbb3-type cytochrome c oxidase subunit I n=1 Tax=Massilia solisilvae TaxID=1811225 RepID=A0ABT2BDY1_9BURK|nr:cbb3-type cytochrome c oxidase subunit I [Massilia solisilvae]MCS0606592.1 cbb3-type cytochrome c oxidase subunit I [Massilia solisilvae]